MIWRNLKDQVEPLAEIEKQAAVSKKKSDEQLKLLSSVDADIKV
jgi:hypothetical protein